MFDAPPGTSARYLCCLQLQKIKQFYLIDTSRGSVNCAELKLKLELEHILGAFCSSCNCRIIIQHVFKCISPRPAPPTSSLQHNQLSCKWKFTVHVAHARTRSKCRPGPGIYPKPEIQPVSETEQESPTCSGNRRLGYSVMRYILKKKNLGSLQFWYIHFRPIV